MQPPIVQNTPQGQGINSHNALPSEEIREIVKAEIAPLERKLKILKWWFVLIAIPVIPITTIMGFAIWLFWQSTRGW